MSIYNLTVMDFIDNDYSSEVNEDLHRLAKNQEIHKGELYLYEIGFDDDELTYPALDDFLAHNKLEEIYIWFDW